jgi:hypothetical protein
LQLVFLDSGLEKFLGDAISRRWVTGGLGIFRLRGVVEILGIFGLRWVAERIFGLRWAIEILGTLGLTWVVRDLGIFGLR